jgi:hypothetical protein
MSIATGAWSDRLWMVQENLLNRNTVMLLGSNILPWMTVTSISRLLSLALLPNIQRVQNFWAMFL